jgi:hypothetical protein
VGLKEKEMTSLTSWIRSIGIAGGILVLAGVQNVSAQVPDDGIEFTTSFPFMVGYATVPAGTYAVRPDSDNPAILELTGGQTAVLFQAENATPRQTPTKSEVVFKHYGDGYLLKQIWIDGSDIGAEAIPVEGEKHMAKRGSGTEERVAARKKTGTSKNR